MKPKYEWRNGDDGPSRDAESADSLTSSRLEYHFVSANCTRQSPRVLIAEDHYVNSRLLGKMLQLLGLESELAEDGHICVNRHRASPFDVILMDVQMPILDGLSATQAIRQWEQQNGVVEPVKIFAITASGIACGREICLAAGMNDYLSKPISLEGLTHLFLKHCLLPRLEIETREEPLTDGDSLNHYT